MESEEKLFVPVPITLTKNKLANKEQVRKRGLPPLLLGILNSGGKPLFLTCSLVAYFWTAEVVTVALACLLSQFAA